MDLYKELRLVKNDASIAIIVNKGRILLVKRINLPFIMDPGIWTFVAGHRRRHEKHLDCAYREIFEETQIRREHLRLISSHTKVMKVNIERGVKYYNYLCVFESKTREVRLNIENTRYRWATISDIERQKDYTNIFENERFILRVIRKALQR